MEIRCDQVRSHCGVGVFLIFYISWNLFVEFPGWPNCDFQIFETEWIPNPLPNSICRFSIRPPHLWKKLNPLGPPSFSDGISLALFYLMEWGKLSRIIIQNERSFRKQSLWQCFSIVCDHHCLILDYIWMAKHNICFPTHQRNRSS